MMAFHKERETAQTWTGIVNMLYRLAGRPLFMTLFPAILEDNGAPFSDPVTTENARADNNPYRLVPRTKVFYCDPYCATQKPHVERNHEELRRILLKGTSFNALDQDDVNVVLSHVNSYTRASLGNSTPYDEFARTYGYEGRQLLDRLPRERGDARPIRARQEVQATRRPHHPQAERREMTSNTEKRRKREK